MKILRPILTLVVLLAAVYLLYTFVLFPLFFHFVKVIHVVDGDTLLVKDGTTVMQVQLIGVDAPEHTGPYKYPQCFDDEATHLTVENFFAKNQEVRLLKDDLLSDTDTGGRSLRYVYLKDGRFLNEKLVESGLAKQYLDPTKKYRQQDQLFKAQKDAQAKNLGIWDARGCDGKF